MRAKERTTSFVVRVAAKLENLAIIRGFIRLTGVTLGADRDEISDLVLAVDELATNVIVHGYRGESGPLEVEVDREGDMLVVHLRDEAPPFDPTSVPPPDLTIPLEERPLGGLGIHLTRKHVDEISHQALPEGGNELTLKKRI
jgi:serine/threonine-protein kinase RsbW